MNQQNKENQQNRKGEHKNQSLGGPGLPGSWNLWFSCVFHQSVRGDPYVSPKRKCVPYALMGKQENQRFQDPWGSGPPKLWFCFGFPCVVFCCSLLSFCLFVVFPYVFCFSLFLFISFTHEWNGPNLFNGPGLQSQTGPYYWDLIWVSSHMKGVWFSSPHSCVKKIKSISCMNQKNKELAPA